MNRLVSKNERAGNAARDSYKQRSEPLRQNSGAVDHVQPETAAPDVIRGLAISAEGEGSGSRPG